MTGRSSSGMTIKGMAGLLGCALVMLLVSGCDIQSSLEKQYEEAAKDHQPLDPELFRREITTIDNGMFGEGLGSREKRTELAGALTMLGEKITRNNAGKLLKIERGELQTLAALVAVESAGIMSLRQNWIRIRANIFDDAAWFARSPADLTQPDDAGQLGSRQPVMNVADGAQIKGARELKRLVDRLQELFEYVTRAIEKDDPFNGVLPEEQRRNLARKPEPWQLLREMGLQKIERDLQLPVRPMDAGAQRLDIARQETDRARAQLCLMIEQGLWPEEQRREWQKHRHAAAGHIDSALAELRKQ